MRGFIAVLLLMFCLPAWARPPAALAPIDPDSCLQAASVAERQFAIPAKLLVAIAEVESVRNDPVTRRFIPWPWTINVEGAGHFYETKQDAIAAVRRFQAAGARSIDVGCMQINLMYHPNAFASLDEAFDPQLNAAYGARFLRDLFRQTASWPQAAAFYHSQTPTLGAAYATNVMARWPLAGRFADASLFAPPAAAKLVDYSVYTPEFAATLRAMDRDLGRGDTAKPARGAGVVRFASAHHGRSSQQPG